MSPISAGAAWCGLFFLAGNLVASEPTQVFWLSPRHRATEIRRTTTLTITINQRMDTCSGALRLWTDPAMEPVAAWSSASLSIQRDSARLSDFETGLEDWQLLSSSTTHSLSVNDSAYSGKYSAAIQLTEAALLQLNSQYQDWSLLDSIALWVYAKQDSSTARLYLMSDQSAEPIHGDISCLRARTWQRVKLNLSATVFNRDIRALGVQLSAGAFQIDALTAYGKHLSQIAVSVPVALRQESSYCITADSSTWFNESGESLSFLNSCSSWTFRTESRIINPHQKPLWLRRGNSMQSIQPSSPWIHINSNQSYDLHIPLDCANKNLTQLSVLLDHLPITVPCRDSALILPLGPYPPDTQVIRVFAHRTNGDEDSTQWILRITPDQPPIIQWLSLQSVDQNRKTARFYTTPPDTVSVSPGSLIRFSVQIQDPEQDVLSITGDTASIPLTWNQRGNLYLFQALYATQKNQIAWCAQDSQGGKTCARFFVRTDTTLNLFRKPSATGLRRNALGKAVPFYIKDNFYPVILYESAD